MAKIVKKDDQSLVVKAYPKCIVGLLSIFLAMFWYSALATEKVITTESYLICHAVILIVFAIQKYQICCFDKHTKTVCVISKSIIGKQEQWFSLIDVDSVEMSYGHGGQYARGSCVALVINNKPVSFIDSDICLGNRQRNIRLKDEVARWL